MYCCYGKGVLKSVLWREVVPFSEGPSPLSEVLLYRQLSFKKTKKKVDPTDGVLKKGANKKTLFYSLVFESPWPALPPSLPVLLDVVDEPIGAGVVASGGRGPVKLRLDDLGKLLAQLNTTVHTHSS